MVGAALGLLALAVPHPGVLVRVAGAGALVQLGCGYEHTCVIFSGGEIKW